MTEKVDLNCEERSLYKISPEEVPQDKILLDSSQARTALGAERKVTGQIEVAQRLYIGRAGDKTEIFSWNLLGLGDVLDYSPEKEGMYVQSPAFVLDDGSVYTFKFTPFPVKGKLAES